MGCEILGFSQNLWILVGLAADFIGVTLLGIDLVRLQRILRSQANDNLNDFKYMGSEYGGIEGWAEEIQKQAKWVPEHLYSDHHAEDEVSFNARKATDAIRELGGCLNALAEHVSKLMMLQYHQAEHDVVTARTSLRFSIIGLTIIAIGFAMQIVGIAPC